MSHTIVILAAGKGTRMLELSRDIPKHLIAVKNKPFLYYSLINIKQAGFNNIILVVGYQKEKMFNFAEEYKKEFSLTLVDQFDIVGHDKYGTACPVAAVESIMRSDNFMVINGDDLYSAEDLSTLKNLEGTHCYAAGFRHQEPQHYGLLKIDSDNFLEYIIEKPKPDIDFNSQQPLDYLVNIGMYNFTPEIFKAINNISLSSRGEYELTDALTWLARKKRVKIIPIKDGWQSFTNPSDVEKIANYLEKK